MDSKQQLDWVISIQEKLEKAQQYVARKPGGKWCIYQMPRRIRDAQESKKFYEPQTVSIGPYHIGNEQVLEMDLYKWVALYQILERTGQDINLYLDSIKEVEEQARACYQQQVKLSSNEFVEMMVLDGCFILELFLCYPARGKPGCNPIFTNKRVVEDIVLDMILLENQIPLFIIDRLLKLMNTAGNLHQNDRALDLALMFFNTDWMSGITMSINELNELKHSLKQEECLHILDVFWRSLIHVRPQQGTINKQGFRGKASNSILSREQVIHRATELRKGGVKFWKRNTSGFLDITFRNGIFEIPPICIHGSTMTILLNLAAFEQ